MTDLTQLSERDLLITLVTKFDGMERRVADIEGRVDTLGAHVQVLHDAAERQRGEQARTARLQEWVFRGPGSIWAIVAVAGIAYAWLHK